MCTHCNQLIDVLYRFFLNKDQLKKRRVAIHIRRWHILGRRGWGLKFGCCKILELRGWNFDMGEGVSKCPKKISNVLYGRFSSGKAGVFSEHSDRNFDAVYSNNKILTGNLKKNKYSIQIFSNSLISEAVGSGILE